MNNSPHTDSNKLQPEKRKPSGKGKIIDGSQSFSKLQPQNREMEYALLGSILLDSNAIAEVIDILTPEMFYVPANYHVYEAVQDLFARSQPIDLITVTERLRKKAKLDDVGGSAYLAKLTNRVGSTANIESYARIIIEKHILRTLIRLSDVTIKDAYSETADVFELLDSAEQGLFNITENSMRRGYEGIDKLVPQAIKEIETISQQEGGLVGIHTGFTDLDRITAGWQKSDLVIIAARPSMGKTAITLSMARAAAVERNVPVAFFSLEMSNLQLTKRLISSETGISQEKLKRGDLEAHELVQLTKQVDALASAPLYVDDTPALSVFELRAKCRRLKMQHKIELIIIDYLQLMVGGPTDKKAGNREQEISFISRSLKSIAKELDVPVIALSQLSRSVETRGGDKRPMLSDLRESGAIEQDADMVMFLYRPEYYKIDVDDDGNSTEGITEIIIGKHRNGATGTVKVKFEKRNGRFRDLIIGSEFDELSNLDNISSRGGYHNEPIAPKNYNTNIPPDNNLQNGVNPNDTDIPF